jgi:hypothetical protein
MFGGITDKAAGCIFGVTSLSVNRSEPFYKSSESRMLIHQCEATHNSYRITPYCIPKSPQKSETKNTYDRTNKYIHYDSKNQLCNCKTKSVYWITNKDGNIKTETKLTNTVNDCHSQKQEEQLTNDKYLSDHSTQNIAEQLLEIEHQLCESLSQLTFPEPVTHVYNPLIYAACPHQRFVHKYCTSHKRVLFLGMNPGPFGMAQTGV